ncbi:MAG: zinc ribbon domain-containing protein [Pyrinomonadaceae bacterium]
MSLIYCPECGHEISTAAVACPSCGRPVTAPPSQIPRVVVERQPKTDSIPPWVIAPVVLLGVLVLFGLIYLVTSSNSDSNSNLSVNVNSRQPETARASEKISTAPSDVSSIPPSTIPVTNTPGVSYPVPAQNVPGSAGSVPTSGTVLIDAKVSTRNGSTQGARNTRFYLLDKDLDTILNDADIEPIEGQSLTNSLALATADQGRYGDFYREAMSALKGHIKYTGSTDGSGKAQLGSVKPDQYYLFGVARTGEGFAMWNSSVSVIAGENAVNLTPQQLTEMPTRSASGE